MSVRLVKLICKDIDCYKDNFFKVDFLAEKKVFEKDINANIVKKIINNIYGLNTISLVGINASGKTTTLKIISDVIKVFIENRSLDYKEMNLPRYFKKSIILETYIFDDSTQYLYKIVSKIEKNDANRTLYFVEERINFKKIKKMTTKKAFFDFENTEVYLDREEVKKEDKSDFLKGEDSIFSGVLNKYGNPKIPLLFDLSSNTNFNFLSMYNNNLPMTFVNYLDHSIESFKVIEKENDNVLNKFEIKFKDDEEIIVTDVIHLEEYLSSGTIKGINVLIQVMLVLQSGGYLLIDEIENHLNKTIVINLINLFNNPLNAKGATLIFTTHYSEVLDTIERSDSIYLLEKKKKILLEKYSIKSGLLELDRLDKKKSDVILSGSVNTAPSYRGYKNLLRDLESIVLSED